MMLDENDSVSGVRVGDDGLSGSVFFYDAHGGQFYLPL